MKKKMNICVPFLLSWFLSPFHCYRWFIITSITDNARISRPPCHQPVMERQTNVLRAKEPEAKSDNIDSLHVNSGNKLPAADLPNFVHNVSC